MSKLSLSYLIVCGMIVAVSTARQSCKRLDKSLCPSNVVPYRKVMFPSRMGHANKRTAALEMRTYLPLIQVECSPHIHEFLCRMYFPECKKNRMVVPPCRRLCEKSKLDCKPVMESFGFPWPAALNCSSLPTTNCEGDVAINSDATSDGSTSDVSTDTEEPSQQCIRIRSRFCTNKDIPYNTTTFPNAIGHSDEYEAGLELHQFYPLVKIGCSSVLRELLCRSYLPECKDGKAIPACRNLCQQSKLGCEKLMVKFGFRWPAALNCSRFPTTNCEGDVSINSDATSDDSTSDVSSNDVSTNAKEPSQQCISIRSGLCANKAIPYNTTIFPNAFGHLDEDEAGLVLQQFYPLVEVGCSSVLRELLCRSYLPECKDGKAIPTCRNLCQQSRLGCEKLMVNFGFRWPAALNCSRYPTTNCGGEVVTDESTNDESTGNVSTNDISRDTNEPPSQCVNITSTICSSNYIPYNTTIFPNPFDRLNEEGTSVELNQFNVLAELSCSSGLWELLCRFYFPECKNGRPILPCRNLCEESRRDCHPLMVEYGFSWPAALNCSHLPTTDCEGGVVTETSNNDASTGDTSTSDLIFNGKCEPMQSRICAKVDAISYNATILPDVEGYSQQYAEQSLQTFYSLVQTECSPYLSEFLCRTFYPECLHGEPRLVCKDFCESVREECESTLTSFGFPWPESISCSKFPTVNCSGVVVTTSDPNMTTQSSLKPQTNGLQVPACEAIRVDVCSSVPYKMTYFPNSFAQATQEEASFTLSQMRPLFQTNCSPHFEEFMCRTFIPKCENRTIQTACRSLCAAVRPACEPTLNGLGFPWPESMDCDTFPTTNCGGRVEPIAESSPPQSPPPPTGRQKCQLLTSSICSSDVINYNVTSFPNSLSHETQRQAETEFQTFSLLMQVGCSADFPSLACRVYFPECKDNKPWLPCRHVCERVKEESRRIISLFGLEWPEALSCSLLPSNKCEGEAPTTPSPITTNEGEPPTAGDQDRVEAHPVDVLLRKSWSLSKKVKNILRAIGRNLKRADKIQKWTNGEDLDLDQVEQVISNLIGDVDSLTDVINKLMT